MSGVYFPVAGASIIILISLAVSLAPATIEDLSQNSINTSELQQSTNISEQNVDANATAGTDAVSQASNLVDVLTKPESGNRLLGYLFLLIGLGLIAWIVVHIWIG